MSAQGPRLPARVVAPRRVQLVTLPVALWALAGAARVVLPVFVVAAVIALILNPMVTVVQRARVPRGRSVAPVSLARFGDPLTAMWVALAVPRPQRLEAATSSSSHGGPRGSRSPARRP